jgi:hypothetical protein
MSGPGRGHARSVGIAAAGKDRPRLLQRIAVAGIVAFAGWLGPGAPAAGAPLPNMPQDYFPLGVFYQPAVAEGTTSFAGWKGRGINTLIGYESQSGTVTIDDYTAAAMNAGLYLIREPRDDPSQDRDPNLIGWLQPDEPENRGIDPQVLQDRYSQLKDINSSRPVLINFDGSHMVNGYKGFTFGAPKTSDDYAPYIQAADWVAQDIYPITGWLNPAAIGVSGAATATLKTWSGNKPTFAYIETSQQRLFTANHPDWPARGPTPAEMRGEVWDAVMHGANGIMYFSQSFTAFRYDSTPIDVAQEMTKQNMTLTGLASAINSDDTPDIAVATFSAGSIEYMTRAYNGVTYLIALNLSADSVSGTMSLALTDPTAAALGDLQVLGESRSLSPTEPNTYSDSFGPYDVHVYAESPLGVAALAVPEPSSALLMLAGIAGSSLVLRRGRGRKRQTHASSD